MSDDAIVLDRPEQISAWVFLSAISQLALEVKTGQNYYGRTSVLKGIQAKGWTSVTGKATKINKVTALAELLHEQPSSPVIDLARKTLDAACAEMGITFEVVERQ
jgi:hypothetical protein